MTDQVIDGVLRECLLERDRYVASFPRDLRRKVIEQLDLRKREFVQQMRLQEE